MRRKAVESMLFSRMNRPSNGFTVVELLVTIGIIGVLTSVLLPTVSGARKQAVTVRCASNLRSMGQAWQQYANENHGTCVPGRLPTGGAPGGIFDVGFGQEYRPRWFELLGAEMKIKVNPKPTAVEDDKWLVLNPLFLCPAVPDYNNGRNYPYGYNHQFLGNARPVMSGAQAYIQYPVRVSRISAAQTVMVVDSLGTAAGKPTDQRKGYAAAGNHDTFGLANKGYLIDPPRMTSTSDYADDLYRDAADRSGPDARHQGKGNALFCDGHVTLMTPLEMGYTVLPDGSMPIKGGKANNTLFSGTGQDTDPPSINGQ